MGYITNSMEILIYRNIEIFFGIHTGNTLYKVSFPYHYTMVQLWLLLPSLYCILSLSRCFSFCHSGSLYDDYDISLRYRQSEGICDGSIQSTRSPRSGSRTNHCLCWYILSISVFNKKFTLRTLSIKQRNLW